MIKKEFRKNALVSRDLILDRQFKSLQILKTLQSVNEFLNACVVFSYMNTNSEVLTFDINNHILSSEKKLGVPKTNPTDKTMLFKNITNLQTDLEIGSYNIKEPLSSLQTLQSFDVILVPAVAFCQNKYRLGYGAGYYDKYLSINKGFKIGLAFDEQIFKTIPKDNFDIKLDIIVTPNQIIC